MRIYHDEDVEVYIDGVMAGSAQGYTSDYETLSLTPQARTALKAGKHVMAIHCRQTSGGQYIDAGLVELQSRPAKVASKT